MLLTLDTLQKVCYSDAYVRRIKYTVSWKFIFIIILLLL